MTEGIISDEDREFISSLGHWTGDPTWDPGPIGGWTGLAKFVLPVPPGIVTAKLTSPNVVTPTNKTIGIVIYTHIPSPTNPINRRLTISDGVYSFVRPWDYQQFQDEWLAVGLYADLPADWDPTNTTLTIELQIATGVVAGIAYADRASLTWTPKKQYLTVVGIG